jgi:hypothetical protein
MDPTSPNAPGFPSRDIISIVVQGCGCDEDKAIELLTVRVIPILVLRFRNIVDIIASAQKMIRNARSSFTVCSRSTVIE